MSPKAFDSAGLSSVYPDSCDFMKLGISSGQPWILSFDNEQELSPGLVSCSVGVIADSARHSWGTCPLVERCPRIETNDSIFEK